MRSLNLGQQPVRGKLGVLTGAAALVACCVVGPLLIGAACVLAVGVVGELAVVAVVLALVALVLRRRAASRRCC